MRISAGRPGSVPDADAGRMTSVSKLRFIGLGGTDEVGASSYLYLLKEGNLLIDAGVRPGRVGEAALPKFELLAEHPPTAMVLTHAPFNHVALGSRVVATVRLSIARANRSRRRTGPRCPGTEPATIELSAHRHRTLAEPPRPGGEHLPAQLHGGCDLRAAEQRSGPAGRELAGRPYRATPSARKSEVKTGRGAYIRRLVLQRAVPVLACRCSPLSPLKPVAWISRGRESGLAPVMQSSG